MDDRFLGAWLVTEYVFEPHGVFAGTVKQRRELRQLAGGRVRVIQRCEPSAELAHHPMSAFAGEWAFDLTIDGQWRRYHGPDVVGSGKQWSDGVMTGRGRWPRFGHDFVSFGFMGTSGEQITGGVFHDDGVAIAQIVGIAREDSAEFPTLPIATDYTATTHASWTALLAAEQPERTARLVAGILLYSTLHADAIGRSFDDRDAELVTVDLAPDCVAAALEAFHRWRDALAGIDDERPRGAIVLTNKG